MSLGGCLGSHLGDDLTGSFWSVVDSHLNFFIFRQDHDGAETEDLPVAVVARCEVIW